MDDGLDSSAGRGVDSSFVSVPGFVLAQAVGGGLGVAAVAYLFPRRTPLAEVTE